MAESWQTIEQAAVSLGVSVRTVNRHMAAGKLPSRLNADGRREVLVSTADTPTAASGAGEREAAHIPETLDAGLPPVTDAVTGTWDGTFKASPPPAAERIKAAPDAAAANLSDSASQFNAAPTPPPLSVDTDMVLALADKAAQKAEMAVTAYQTLARVADTQVRESRRNARLAWAAAAVMAAGVTATVGWATRHVTRASADVERLQGQVVADKDALRTLADKQEALRVEQIAAEHALRTELAAQHDKALAQWSAAEGALRDALVTAREQAARAEGQLAAYRQQDEARQTREAMEAAAAALSLDSDVEMPEVAGGLDAILGSDSQTAVEAVRPTTRQSAPRRKAAVAATTRPSAGVPESTASTAEDR